MYGAFLPAMTLATTRLGIVRWQGWDRIAAILAVIVMTLTTLFLFSLAMLLGLARIRNS